jgi:hypothetical protein
MSDDTGKIENHTERLLGFNVTVGDEKKFVKLIPGENELDEETFRALKGSDYFKTHKDAKNVSVVKSSKKDKKKKKDKE